MDAGEPQDFIAVAPIVLKDRKEGVPPDMNSNNPLAVEPETEKDAARENLLANLFVISLWLMRQR
jgi:hypothetical protein